MNHNQDYAFNSLKIISNSDSYDNNSGSLTINGGIGCKKTIHCNSICSDNAYFKSINITDNFNIEILNLNNLISNNIQSDTINFIKILPTDSNSTIGDDDNKVDIVSNNINVQNLISNQHTSDLFTSDIIKFNSILPIDDTSLIGNCNNKVTIYSKKIITDYIYSKQTEFNSLSINNDLTLSKNYNNQFMINTNTQENITTLNFDILNLNNTFNNFKINDDGIIIDGITILNYQTIDLNQLINEYILPNKSTIIITHFKNCNFNLSNYKIHNDSSSMFLNGSIIKLINFTTSPVQINNTIIHQNDSLQFIFYNLKWNALKPVQNNTIIPNNYCCDDDDEFSIN
jgi:hypothetical protein